MPADRLDAIVVGAGPAGSAAALELARAGRSVVLLERGPFPGSKNVYGGVVYGRVLDDVIPRWWEQVPVQRWVVRRSTMLLTGSQALSVDFRTESWGAAPYNGMTVYRSDFDSWLAGHATAAGAELVTSTVATGLLRDDRGAVAGVRTDRPGGELRARAVIACDGVNSFLAKEAGLLPRVAAAHHTLGVKEVLGLPPEVIEERFGVGAHRGVDIEMLGATGGIPGGGFLYTNADSVSVGVVVSLPGLAAARSSSSPTSRPTRRSRRTCAARRSRNTRPTSSPRAGTTRCRGWRSTAWSSPGTRRACASRPACGWKASTSPSAPGWRPAGPWPARWRPVTRPPADWPATAGTWSQGSCSLTTSGCEGPRGWSSATGSSSATPG